jgi:hypothetical protein
MVPTSIQQQTGVSSALHLLIVISSEFAPKVPDNVAHILPPWPGPSPVDNLQKAFK